MSAIPAPPVDPELPGRPRYDAHDLIAASAGGVYGTCCLCQGGGTRWLDLSALGMPPVVDQTGTLTDQVALDERCAAGLVAHWATMLGSGPGDDEPSTDGAGREDAPVQSGEADSVTWAASRAASDRVALMGGMYAR